MTNKSTKVLAAFGLVAGLGMAAALPMVAAQPGHAYGEPASHNTQINAIVGESISITSTDVVNVEVGANDKKAADGNFIVSTNRTQGYNVTVVGSGAEGSETGLKHTTADPAQIIP